MEAIRRTLDTVPHPARNARKRLIQVARGGGITLVLGAGVSLPRGIPDWDTLAHKVWQEVFAKKRSPWKLSDTGRSPRNLPQFLPIIFELAYRELGEKEFARILRERLYEHANFPIADPKFSGSKETLAILARTIVQEHRMRMRQRISSVITFNADDLIEQAVCQLTGASDDRRRPSAMGIFRQMQTIRAVVRSTHAWAGQHRSPFIPVYHIHGFLPSGRLKAYSGHYEYMLVFTDTQYWSTSVSSFSFANRIMAAALSEGCCIFVGISMTDINLLRWLALRTLERDRDFLQAFAASDRKVSPVTSLSLRAHFPRHFWIRPKSDDPDGFLSKFLLHRGIQTVEIDSWQTDSFQKLMLECFPALEDESG